VLSKLDRTVPDIRIHLAAGRQPPTAGSSEDRYGEITYAYGERTDMSRSTSPREVLPLLYGLADIPAPPLLAAPAYPGYPLVADGRVALVWFFGALPALILVGWWWSRRPPRRFLPFR
jgi:ABC-2 type transport system permease protein